MKLIIAPIIALAVLTGAPETETQLALSLNPNQEIRERSVKSLKELGVES